MRQLSELYTLNNAMRLMDVKRYTILPVTREQSVAEHTYGVGVLATYLWEQIEKKEDLELLMWAFHHDIEEAIIGDVPTPSKEFLLVKRDLGKIAPPEKYYPYIKLADYIEALRYMVQWGAGAATKMAARDCYMNLMNYVAVLDKEIEKFGPTVKKALWLVNVHKEDL